VPRVAVIVLVCSVISVATHHLATVPGIAAVIVAPPRMELVVAFPGIVVNFSLLPESLDFSQDGGISEGSRHGKLTGELAGVEGVGGELGNLDGEDVAFSRGLLYGGSSHV